MFKSWGYGVEDSEWLRGEMAKQGLERYVAGEYTLGKLNENGQRINIVIEIERKDKKEMVSFVSGWMVYALRKFLLVVPNENLYVYVNFCEALDGLNENLYPSGLIALTTPYGGK